MPTTKGFIVAILATVILPGAAGTSSAEPPRTMRVDYYHSGNALTEMYSLHQVVLEPLPWPGHPGRAVDDTDRGHFLFQVEHPVTGAVLYSRGFSSIFQEWQSTAEARTMNRTFHESVRFPAPTAPVRLRILARDDRNVFTTAWTADIDPDDLLVVRSQPPAAAALKEVEVHGPPSDKVDVLFLGDGFTAEEAGVFDRAVQESVAALFSYSPYRERREDFNIWALMPPADESGVNRPSSGTHRSSPIGATYDAFRSERYVLAFDNLGLRTIAQHAPYEFLVILVNSETYGGGGIFGLYSTAAAGSDWLGYLVVHEFGHHFAALADEYYTSPNAYESGEERPEPWEPNATALQDPARLKWRHLVTDGTPLPTPWPKEAFEAHQREYQEKRRQLRAEDRPEAEMNALFDEVREFTEELFASAGDTNHLVGAFEGAHYQASGYYRPEMNCLMFTRHGTFCRVCREAIEEIIDLYAPPS